MAIGEAIGDRRLLTYAACMMGWAHAATGDPEAAIRICRDGLERASDPVITAAVLGYLGYAYLENGNTREAIPPLEEAAQRFAEFRLRQLEGRFTALLAEAFIAAGQIEKARILGRRALDVATAVGYGFGVGGAYRALGRAAAAAGDVGEAQGHLREALQTFAGVQARFEVARMHVELAGLAHAKRDRDEVASHLRAAHAAFGELRVLHHAERTERLATKLGVSLGRDP